MGNDWCCVPPEGPQINSTDPASQVATHCPPNQQCLAGCPRGSLFPYYCCFPNPVALTTTTTTTTPPPPAPSGGCFPATSKVNLIHGKSVTMSELHIGDQVQTGKESF